MGLTIHYSMHLDALPTQSNYVRGLIEQLQQRAKELPFETVGDLVDFKGTAECDFELHEDKAEHRWLRIQACEYISVSDTIGARVVADRIIGFETLPGRGSEEANFGLCHYPVTVMVEGESKYIRGKGWVKQPRRVRTKLAGWRWHSFCKTQYASDPNHGGAVNFLKCHLAVVALLEEAKEMGISVEVSDEGHHWENRDVKALTSQVGEWNETIAAGYGAFKDKLGSLVTSPISKFPNMEHLEAAAVARLSRKKKGAKDGLARSVRNES